MKCLRSTLRPMTPPTMARVTPIATITRSMGSDMKELRASLYSVGISLFLGGERTGRRSVHCHSVVNVRGGTLRGEWQYVSHCQTASSVPYRYDQGRVAVRLVRSGASGSVLHTATRR